MTAIERPLTDEERTLLLRLAVHTLAEQNSVAEQVAADVLDDYADKGQAVIEGDNDHVVVTVAGNRLVSAARDWLAFHAAYPANDPLSSGRWVE